MKDSKFLVSLDEKEMSPVQRYYLIRALLIALAIAAPLFIGVAAFVGWLIYS